MAQRNDFTINWGVSPRIITIAKPSTSCLMQDLHDTLSFMQSESSAIDNKPIVDSSGKETLDLVTEVGLTVTLQNAQVGFEARDGTEFGGVNEWTNCVLDGGNCVAVNADKVTMDEIANNAFVNVKNTKSSSATTVIVNTGSGLSDEQNNVLMMTKYQNKAVYVDTARVINGDGSATSPFNTVAHTTDFAEANGIKIVFVYSDVIIDRNVKSFTVIGIGTPVVECNGQDLKNTEFSGVQLRGTYTDRIKAKECLLGSGFELNGSFKDCSVVDDVVCIDGGVVTLHKCFANNGGARLSLNGSGSSVVTVIDFNNNLTVTDVNNVLDEVNITMETNKLTLDVSCTNGDIVIAGNPLIVDNSNGSTVDTSAMSSKVTAQETLYKDVGCL